METRNQLVSYQYEMAEILLRAVSVIRKSDPELILSGLFPKKLLQLLQRFYNLYDESCRLYLAYMKKTLELSVTCRIGCSWCCYQMPSGLYTFEYIYIYEGIVKINPKTLYLPRLLDRSEHFSSMIKGHKNLHRYIARGIPCAFLNLAQNTCDIYPYRPLICRSYFSLSPPRYCHPIRFDPESQDKFNIEPSEVLERAFKNLDSSLPFKLSPIMGFGILEFGVNIMRCRPIRWMDIS